MTPEQLAAMEQALEALEKTRDENVAYMDFKEPYHEAITALRTAIEQAKRQQALDKMAENERELGIQMQPEPVAWIEHNTGRNYDEDQLNWQQCEVTDTPLYTHPAPAAPVQEPVAFNAGVPPLYPEMKDGETISVEYTTPPTEPVQETSGCRHKRYSVDVHEQIGICYDCGAEGRMRFVVGDATPPAAQQQWVGLTDEEIEKMAVENGHATFLNDDEETGIIWFDGDATPYARAIEQKLRERNRGAA